MPPEEVHLAAIIDQAGGLEMSRGNPHVLEALLAVQRQYDGVTLPGPDIVDGTLVPDHWRTSRSADNYRQRRRVMLYSPQATGMQGMVQSLPGLLIRVRPDYALLLTSFTLDLQILMQELQDTTPDAAIFTNFPNWKRKLQLVNIYQPVYMQVTPNMDTSQSAGQHETVNDLVSLVSTPEVVQVLVY